MRSYPARDISIMLRGYRLSWIVRFFKPHLPTPAPTTKAGVVGWLVSIDLPRSVINQTMDAMEVAKARATKAREESERSQSAAAAELRWLQVRLTTGELVLPGSNSPEGSVRKDCIRSDPRAGLFWVPLPPRLLWGCSRQLNTAIRAPAPPLEGPDHDGNYRIGLTKADVVRYSTFLHTVAWPQE